MSQPRNEHNATVDAFRGLAAVCVVISHFATQIQYAHFPASDWFHDNIGDWITFLFRGSSVYFFVVSGFVIASRLPSWNQQPRGVLLRGAQRMFRLISIFWLAMGIILFLNFVKFSLNGTAWVQFKLKDIITEFFLVHAVFECNSRLIPPSWYLEADLVLFLASCLSYKFFTLAPSKWRTRLVPFLFLASIPLTVLALFVESHYLLGHGAEAPLRGLGYFLLGVLASQAKSNGWAKLCLVINSMLFLGFAWFTKTGNYLCTSFVVAIACIFVASQYLPSISRFFSHWLFRKLNDWNFSLFLINFFVFTVAISIARHATPHSVWGMVSIMLLATLVIFTFAYFFFGKVQVPVLRWLDKCWEKIIQSLSSKEVTGKVHSNPNLLIDPGR